MIVSAVIDGEYDKTNVPDPLILTTTSSPAQA